MKFRVLIIATGLLCLVSAPVMGAGFSIFEQGAAATGMAGAFTAHADDPSAIFYNPAGITQLEGTQISLGVTLIKPSAEMKAYNPYTQSWSEQEWETDDQVFVPPNFYVTHKLMDNLSLGFGYGVYYGLGVDWSKNSDFPYVELIKEVNLQSNFLNPVAAFQINENISVAAGIFYVLSTVDYKRELGLTEPNDPNNGEMKLDADNGSGDFGFNLGFHGNFGQFRAGLTYRSEVECGYEGSADFDVPASAAPLFPDQDGRTTITMPASASLGFAYFATDALSVEFDLNWMGWSSYESLDIDFSQETFHPATGDPVVADTSQIKDWDDVFSYRLGMRYLATDALSIYAGYLYDESPVPDNTLDPILPDSDRQSVQVGAGYKIGDLKIDASYMALFFEDRETTTNIHHANGQYENFAHLFGLQFTYGF